MRYITRICIVIFLAGLVTWRLATPVIKVMYKYTRHDNKRFNEIFEKHTPYDVLFIGASRTHRTIYPRIIDSICAVSSYNAGIEAASMPDIKMAFDGYMASHPSPDLVVLSFDLASFSAKGRLHSYPMYYPYLNNPGVRENMAKYYKYNVALFELLPFMSIIDYDDYAKENALNMLRGRDTMDILAGDFEYKGFLSNTDKQIKSAKIDVKSRNDITNESVACLHAIVDTCRQRKVTLIFTYPPEYRFYLQKSRTNGDTVFNLIYAVSKDNNILFLRHDSLPMCQSPTLFANYGHVNRAGAMVYSAILANELKPLISDMANKRH